MLCNMVPIATQGGTAYLTPMMPAAEGMSFSTGFMRMTALPSFSASSTYRANPVIVSIRSMNDTVYAASLRQQAV